jgi:NAD(P)-dependent dehydrogenase (short-subunit alcohol dehydrogenase family)
MFQDKVVWVIGAGQGIGRTAAGLFAAAGATVVVSDRNPAVQDVFDALKTEHPDLQGFAATQDVSVAADNQRVGDEIVERFGRIDVLAHIAGVVQTAGPAEELPEEDWDRVMSVNLKGPFLTSKVVVPVMRRQGSGKIVYIGSYYGRHGVAYFSAYCASKAAVMNFTASLALEVADAGINVNSIAPGMINTEMHQGALQAEADARGISYDEMRDTEWGKTPFKRAGDPEDIANAVLFLSSDQAAYITGASLDVNGGVLTR